MKLGVVFGATGASQAVLLVDMQYYFLRRMSKKQRDELVAAQTEVLRYCAAMDIPVVFLEYKAKDVNLGETVIRLRRELRKVPRCHRIRKSYDSGFVRTRLSLYLRSLGIKELVVMGVNKSSCVFKTARSAVRLGYVVRISDVLAVDCRSETAYRSSRDKKYFQRVRRWYARNIQPLQLDPTSP